MSRLRAWLREPLLHFLALGGGLFLLFSGSRELDADRIVVTPGRVEHLVGVFSKLRQRSPTGEELKGLIDAYILEEVLYREAIAIGLDRDDPIIRRRLKQKMEFLVDDSTAAEPSDAELQRFLDANPERFRRDARIDFEHVYFNGSESERPASLLLRLQAGEAIDTRTAGDALPLPGRFEDASETEIRSIFGEGFTKDLWSREKGRWTGPVESPFGLHLVKVDALVDGRIPELAEVRAAVEREWMSEQRRVARQAFFDELRSKYTVILEADGGSSG